MSELFSEMKLKNCRIKNRVVFPAMVVCDLESPDGRVTPAHLRHYRWVADRGAGLVVTGAVCIAPEGRLSANQLGAWSDEFIEGLAEIPRICHERDVPVLMQIHHAGYRAVPAVTDELVSSSDCDENGIKARALTIEEIKELQDGFAAAALRAQKAGFDGVELHCAHIYLLDQFLSSSINKRTDEYGGSVENRTRFAAETLKKIRELTGPDFIVACRMGCNTPTLEDAAEIAKRLETAGADLLDVSYSTVPLPRISEGEGPQAPADFAYGGFVYGARKIKESVSVPVCTVWQIDSDEAGTLVEEGHTDLVAVLRGILVDPDWVSRAKEGEKSRRCFHCRPVCRWFTDRTGCPAWQKLDPERRLNK